MDVRLTRQLTSSQERGEYLELRSEGMFGSSWTRYFFIVLGEQQVLRRTNGEADTRGSLLYYQSDKDAFKDNVQPLGCMSLATCAIQEMQESESRGTYAFSITSKSAVWQLRTVSAAARLNWIVSLRSQQGTYLSSWTNKELLECLDNIGERTIDRDTRRAIEISRFTGQQISDLFKEAHGSRNPRQAFRHSLEDQLGNLTVNPEQTDQLFKTLSEILLAAADSESTDETAAQEDLHLSIKVLRWMFVKDARGSSKYVAYEVQVTAPFHNEHRDVREPDTRTYLQRWSQISRFNDKFKTWAQKTAKVAGTRHMFKQEIPSKWSKQHSDPKALEQRKMELNDYLAKMTYWANEAADKRLINLFTLIDDVVVPCFGADQGGRSPLGKRVSENVQDVDQLYAGWLNFVLKKKSNPFHAVLARAPVTVKGEDSRTVGCDKGTFALYHGPKESHADWAIPLSGVFVVGCEEMGPDSADQSPKDMHGLHQFTLQQHQSGTDRRGQGTFALQKFVFSAADEEVVEEWVRKCRQQQRDTFDTWSEEELAMWMQATGAFDETEPLVDCGINAAAVVKYVSNDDSRKLKKALAKVGLQKEHFDDLWSKLEELLTNDLGTDLADQENDSLGDTSRDEQFHLHVPIDAGWTNRDFGGFVLIEDFIVKKIKKRTAAADVEGACEGMQLIRVKGSGLRTPIKMQSLSFSAGMAQLVKARAALNDEGSLTMVFKLPWEKQEDDNHDSYYWNRHTDETTWDQPEAVSIAIEATKLRRTHRDLRRNAKMNPNSPWVGYFDEDSGEPYYVRRDTDESSWEEPRAGISGWGDSNKPSEDAEEANEDGDMKFSAVQGELMPRESGELTVKVVHCRDLIAADPAGLGGLSDPYVKLSLGGRHQTETECCRNTVDPDFNFDALFRVGANDSRDALKLRVEVWDWNKGRSDDILGMVEIPLPSAFAGGWTDNADLAKGTLYQLKDPDSRVDQTAVAKKRELIANRSSTERQKIKALLKGLDNRAPWFDKDNLYGAILLEMSFEPGQGKIRRPASSGRLQVSEISCKRILPTSTADLSSTYCEFWLANKPKKTQATSVCKKSLEPRWHEDPAKPWEFVVTENAEEDLTLHIEVKSKSSKSLLGQCKIDLTREFVDGWTPDASCTAKSLLSDPYGQVRKKDIDRVRKPEFKGRECPTEELYGSIKITMVFRQDEVSRNSLTLTNIPSVLASSDIRSVGKISMQILGAKGGFLIDDRRDQSSERKIYFEVEVSKDGLDVLPIPKMSKKLSMGRAQELRIKDQHLSRAAFEIESPKGRPDVITVRCMQEGDSEADMPLCLGICQIDIRHKSDEAWITPQGSAAVDFKPIVQHARFDGAEFAGAQEDVADRFRLEEELCTVLCDHMQVHGDDRERILRAKNRQQDDRRRRSPGRGRGAEARAHGDPLNWLKVSMSWTPADVPERVERSTDITGVWRATMNMMPTGEDTDYDVELNPNSPWVGIWQDGKPFFFNDITREDLGSGQELPDEGIKEWKMSSGTITRPNKEKVRRKGKKQKRSLQQETEFVFLYEETQSDGRVVIGGHEADVQVSSEDSTDFDWQGAESQHRFTIRNARLVDGQLCFEMVREPTEGLFSNHAPEVTRWEATLNFASRRLYNGKISGARCGTFEATRPMTHACEETRTIPMQKLCPELKLQYSSGRSTDSLGRTISLQPAVGDAEKKVLQLAPAAEEHLQFSKDVAEKLKTLVKPDDKHSRKSARKGAKLGMTKQQSFSHPQDTQVTFLEASSETMFANVEISKQRHKRGWMGSLHVVSEQTVDWTFTLRIPKIKSLEIVVESLELDDDDLDGQKVYCTVGRPYRSESTTCAETKKVEVDGDFVEWEDPHDRPVLKILEPADPSYCFIDICASKPSRTLATVRVPLPKYMKDDEESQEDFEQRFVSEDVDGTLSGYVLCRYDGANCRDTLDLSLWFCQTGQQLAREVIPRHRCLERSGTFVSRTAGQLLYLVEDELWNPVRVAGAHSAPPCTGTVSVRVIGARDLIAADRTGLSDPYVKLQMLNSSVKNEQKKTGVVKRQLNPIFDEDFDFNVEKDGSLELHVEVWDQDVLEQDDFLGEVKIPIADVMDAGANSELGMAWLLRPPAPLFYPLEDAEGKAAEDQSKSCARRRGEPLGAIQLAFGFFLSQADRKPPPAEQGILSITLEQCLDLLPTKMEPKPSSQVYVKFKCGKESKQSNVCEVASLCPEWHGADGRYQLTIGQDKSQQDLEVEVYSNEKPAKLLGCCTINLPTLFYYGWEEPDQPVLVHQLGPTTKDGKEAHYQYLLHRRKIMSNSDRTVANGENPDNEFGAIRMRVEYSRSRGRQSPRRNRWSPLRKSDDVALAPAAGTLRVVAARALLQHKARDSYLSLRVSADERKITQKATEVEMTETEGRSKMVEWKNPMEFEVPQGEDRLYVEVFECSDSNGRSPKLVDSGDLEYSMISGQGYDPVNLQGGDIGVSLKAYYMETAMTGIWKAKKDDEMDGKATEFIMLREAKDRQITGSCVWDDGDEDFQAFDITSGERDHDTNQVTFEQRHLDGDGSSTDWTGTLRNSEIRDGEYAGLYNGTFRAKQLQNENAKTFRLELTTEDLDHENRGKPSRESVHKAHCTGITRRLHSHCEQRNARKPRQMRHGMMALQNLPPTPLALEKAYAMYGSALDENADREPQSVDPENFQLWQSMTDDADMFHASFEDLNEEFIGILRRDRADAPYHQRYCNAPSNTGSGLSADLPPPPWLLDSAERAAMAEINHGHEHFVERRIKDVFHAGAQLALKLLDAGVNQLKTIAGDSDDVEDDDSDEGDPEPEVELFATRTRRISDSGKEDHARSPPPSPKKAARRSRSPSKERRPKRTSVDQDEHASAYSVGDTVEVFSKHEQGWKEGKVLATNDAVVKVEYPSRKGLMQKSLQVGSGDLRQLARRATPRSPNMSPSSRLTLSPATGSGKKTDGSKMKVVTVNNNTEETLTLHFGEGTKRVKRGTSVQIRMRKGDEIFATAKDETVWGPETLGREPEFNIDGDLMTWTGSTRSPQGSRQRSKSKRTSDSKKKGKKGTKDTKDTEDTEDTKKRGSKRRKGQ